MQGMSMIFFISFGLIMVVMYIVVRRQWINPGIAAAVGIVAGTITMMLTLSEMNPEMMDLQAILFGFILGTAFTLATLAVAWYFHTNELREQKIHADYAPEPMRE
jgi:xanthine/uracil permease